jgi:hypothetical protein
MCAGLSGSQIDLPGPRLPRNLPLPSLDDLLRKEEPLATLLQDAPGTGFPEFSELRLRNPRTLSAADRRSDGTYLLKPGHYKLSVHSFCGQFASFVAPPQVSGYVAARYRGSKAKLLRTLLDRYSLREDVPQADMQKLVWAVLSRVKPQHLKGKARRALETLMGPDGDRALAEGALDAFADEAFARVVRQASKELRGVLEAENKVRSLYRQGVDDFEAFQRIAVLDPPKSVRSQLPADVWQMQPNGVLFRYKPRSFLVTDVEIVVPRRATIERDATGRVAALVWSDGFKIGIEYSSQPPVAVPRKPDKVAHFVRRVRIEAPGAEPIVSDRPGLLIGRRYASLYATVFEPLLLAGAAQDDPVIEVDLEDIARDEAEGLVLPDRLTTYRDWWQRFDRMASGRGPDDDLVEGSHVWRMLRSLFQGRDERLGVIADTHGRMAEHLAEATRTLDDLPTESTTDDASPFDPSRGVAVPGAQGGQRLLVSGRPV